LNRNIALDILKLAMSLMVVGLHAGFLGEFTSLGQHLTVNGLFRIAVPIFFIVNGFYFYPVLSKNNQFSWLKRVFILYVFWMASYSYYWFFMPDFSFSEIFDLSITIIFGYHHLWYLSGIIGAAIILIILHRLPSFILVISIVLTFLGGVLIQYLGYYHIFEGGFIDELFNYSWFYRNMLFFSYPFFCIGYLINKHSLHNVVSFKSASILSVLGLFVLLSESYANYYLSGRDRGFDIFLSLLLVCPFIVILFLKSNISGSNKNISLYSSAIYFIHPFLLIVLRKHTGLGETSLTLVTISTSVLISCFIIKAKKHLKFIL